MVLFGNIPFFVEHHITIVSIAFLNRMSISFILILLVMTMITMLKPRTEPAVMPIRLKYDMKPAPGMLIFGGVVVLATAAIYIRFW
jgi:uncharacterized sodium:solute symporter family permease YidK